MKEGIAKDEMVKGFCGTIPYMAPEIMRNEYYDFSVDWYSFGVVLYELLIGPVDLLGSDEATSRYYQAILSGPWRVSVEATSILNGFLNMNPEERLGSNLENGFNDISSHSFFASINWDRIFIDTAKSTLGLTRGGNKSYKELWWWNEEVQTTIQEKKALYKILYKSKNPNDKTNYKKSKRIATKAVTRAKAMAHDVTCFNFA
ncbi:protein kinase C zeta type-like [Gordionus sp. m RMFG-2023]|uniref:protein kinase C zeta type-like n=1 Tax=Gordionus sp. m RMFG-2023 TaxID=3053472 RepID=UPI0031FBC054